jgi:hypothetical protein
MLATRTGFDMQDIPYPKSMWYHDSDTNLQIYSSFSEYYAECIHIELVIHRRFFHALTQESPFADKSPDLTQCYYALLEDLDKWRKVRSKWLSWSTEDGYLLYGMLVAAKMRRYLREKQTYIEGTEGWVKFVKGMTVLQGKILEKVGERDGEKKTRAEDVHMKKMRGSGM